ncbi:MAG TPA: hypothetical protein VHZ03_34170 [Trebonia sp.]|jgi:hypothetical protein|nr:hypothetical protein [Trebonia sp.]
MRLARSSLCAILLEQGEENLAALIARAGLPEILDSERDAPALAALGLAEEDLLHLLPAVRGDLPVAVPASAETDRLSRTVSDRWSHLVDVWASSSPSPPTSKGAFP